MVRGSLGTVLDPSCDTSKRGRTEAVVLVVVDRPRGSSPDGASPKSVERRTPTLIQGYDISYY